MVVNPSEQTIKDLTKQVYYGYKRSKELSKENHALKEQINYMKNNTIPLR